MKTFLSLILIASLLQGCFVRKLSLTPTEEIKKAGRRVENSGVLQEILNRQPQHFDTLLAQKDQWRIAIIYTQIDRTAGNRPVMTHYYFNLEPDAYFYPASTVKMPTAVLALQRLNEWKRRGVDRNTTMITDAAYSRQDAVYNDPNAPDGRPTIANYIKKIFLVSDNDAYNRLFEFLGPDYINQSLQKMGYDSVQIIHRLNIFRTEDENRHTNPVFFHDTVSGVLFRQPLVKSNLEHHQRKQLLGKGYYSGNRLIEQPFDFSKKNRIGLQDLHSMMQALIFPGSVTKKLRFGLTKDDYEFLYRYMSMKPGESRFPQYDTGYNGAYSKLLFFGGKGDLPQGIRIFNKEGDAYGFLTDVAYVTDFVNHIEFFLSATIYCNRDEIFNDDRYDYETVGLPFLKNLGMAVYQYELQRKRKRIPDLSTFQMNYLK